MKFAWTLFLSTAALSLALAGCEEGFETADESADLRTSEQTVLGGGGLLGGVTSSESSTGRTSTASGSTGRRGMLPGGLGGGSEGGSEPTGVLENAGEAARSMLGDGLPTDTTWFDGQVLTDQVALSLSQRRLMEWGVCLDLESNPLDDCVILVEQDTRQTISNRIVLAEECVGHEVCHGDYLAAVHSYTTFVSSGRGHFGGVRHELELGLRHFERVEIAAARGGGEPTYSLVYTDMFTQEGHMEAFRGGEDVMWTTYDRDGELYDYFNWTMLPDGVDAELSPRQECMIQGQRARDVLRSAHVGIGVGIDLIGEYYGAMLNNAVAAASIMVGQEIRSSARTGVNGLATKVATGSYPSRTPSPFKINPYGTAAAIGWVLGSGIMNGGRAEQPANALLNLAGQDQVEDMNFVDYWFDVAVDAHIANANASLKAFDNLVEAYCLDQLTEEEVEDLELDVTPGDSDPADNNTDLACPPGQRAQFVCVSADNPTGYTTGGGQDGGTDTDRDMDETTGSDQYEYQTGNNLDNNGGRGGAGGTDTDEDADDDEDVDEDEDSGDDLTWTDDDEILVIGQRLYPTFECGMACR